VDKVGVEEEGNGGRRVERWESRNRGKEGLGGGDGVRVKGRMGGRGRADRGRGRSWREGREWKGRERGVDGG